MGVCMAMVCMATTMVRGMLMLLLWLLWSIADTHMPMLVSPMPMPLFQPQEVTYKTYTPTVETNVVATNLPVPVAVGGYKSVAGDNGELKGAVHEVPALFGAPALNTQVNEASQGSLTVGTSAVVTHTVG